MNQQSYIDLAKHIRLKVPATKSIDIFNNQYDEPERHHPLNTPCVLIEWLPTEWMDSGSGVQEGAGGFRLHCVVQAIATTQNIDKVSNNQAAIYLQHLTFHNDVHAAVNGFAPSGYSALQRVRTVPDHRYNSIIVIVHEYTATERDESGYAYKDHTLVPVLDFPITKHID